MVDGQHYTTFRILVVVLEGGLERLLRPLFPRGGAGIELYYIGMRLGEPTFSEQACVDLEQTYRCPVWLTLRQVPGSEGTQSFLLGEIPLLTERDTLIVRGQERTPIGQFLLTPGVYFERTERTVSVCAGCLTPDAG